MRNFWNSCRVVVAEEGEDAKIVWKRYRDKAHRNKAKAYRRKRVVAGAASDRVRVRRPRFYRVKGRKAHTAAEQSA